MEAALQKVRDIENLLTACAELLRNHPSEETKARTSEHKLQPKAATGATKDVSSTVDFDPSSPDGSSFLESGDEKLTHYIVRLESELGYYKYLYANSVQQETRPHLQVDHFDVATSVKSDSQCTPQQTTQTEDDESRVLMLVFCQLPTIDLCRASLVCRKWRQVAVHPLLWRRVSIENVVLFPHALQAIAARCGECNTLSLQGLMPVMAQCDEELNTYITRIKGCLEPPLALLLSTSGPLLQHICLVDCDLLLTDRCLWLLSRHCPNLLNITYSSEAFPPTKEALWSLSNGCPLIRQLSLPPVNSSSDLRQLDDGCLEQIAYGWPSLLQLSVGGRSITYTALASLFYRCSGLQSLELTECAPIDTEVVSLLCDNGQLSSLHTLTLMFTRVTPQAVVDFIGRCTSLVDFDLYISPAVYSGTTDPQIAYKYLRVLENLKELDGHPGLRNVFHLHCTEY